MAGVVGGTEPLLLLVKLGTDEQLEYEAHVYSGDRPPGRIEVAVKKDSKLLPKTGVVGCPRGCDGLRRSATPKQKAAQPWLRGLRLYFPGTLVV